MDTANEALCLVGHAISLDKMLTRIARLAPSSMLSGVRTHQHVNKLSKQATNHSADSECNWHYNKALHRFFIWAFFLVAKENV